MAYGSKTFTPSQLLHADICKGFLAIYYAFKEFGYIFWETPKLIIFLTDTKSVMGFPDKSITNYTLECLRLRDTIQFYHSSQTRQKQHSGGLPVPYGNGSQQESNPKKLWRCRNQTQ